MSWAPGCNLKSIGYAHLPCILEAASVLAVCILASHPVGGE